MPKLLTDWLTIGTSGPTIDGREIKPEWIDQMAETYDPENYTAVINVEHRYGNLGTVRELRAAPDKLGRKSLQARIRPNKYYLNNIGEDMGLFFSMEVTHNFAKTGKCYLSGVASTDKPASLGTTEAHFKAGENQDVMLSESIEIDPAAFTRTSDDEGVVSAMVSAFKEIFTTNHKPKKEAEMTKEEVQELLSAANKPLSEAIEKLTATVEGFAKKTPETEQEKTPVTQSAAEKAPDEKFTELSASVEKMAEAFSTLGKKLDEAFEGKGKDIPPGTKPNDAPAFV